MPRYRLLIDVVIDADDDIAAIGRLQEALLYETDGEDSGYKPLPELPGSVNLIECEVE